MQTLRTLRGPALRRFLLHYAEMLLVMGVGMAVLGPLESFALGPLGWAEVRAAPEGMTLVMAANMSVAMLVWMRFRGHGWAPTVEMALAMALPFVVLVPFLTAALLSLGAVMVAGHVLMLLAMLGVMLRRVGEYIAHRHGRRAPASRAAVSGATSDGV